MISLENLLAAMLWIAPWSEYGATKSAARVILSVHDMVHIEVAFAATVWLHRGGGYAAWARLNDPSGRMEHFEWHQSYCREVGDCNPVRMNIAVALARFSAGTDCSFSPGMVGMPAAVTFARTGHCRPDAATDAWARSFRMIFDMLSPGIELRTP